MSTNHKAGMATRFDAATIKGNVGQGDAIPRRFLTAAQAAQELCLSYSSILRHVKSGKIPSAKVGSRLLIPRSFIEGLGV